MEAASALYNRSVSNVSMAMPHAALVAASSLGQNNLPEIQHSNVRNFPLETIQLLIVSQTSTTLILDAQTVVPVVNVLCAKASADDLVPLIYQNWSHPAQYATNVNMTIPSDWYSETVFDPIFGFRPSSPPPVFIRRPEPNNSLLNGNGHAVHSLYLLLAFNESPEVMYELCSLSMRFRGGCSSQLTMSASGSVLRSNCNQHDMSYAQSVGPVQANISAAWTNLASGWAEAAALSSDLVDTNGGMPHMLADLCPGSDPKQPLLVEALAMLSANTLLDSMVDAPFNGSWPFSSSPLKDPVLQPFTARVTMSDYASGETAPWQNVFMLVLGSVFLLNVGLLTYLIGISYACPGLSCLRRGSDGLRKDRTDMEELFQIALNSPQPGQGSPADRAQEKGKFQNLKWHFRDDIASPVLAGDEKLSIEFKGDVNRNFTQSRYSSQRNLRSSPNGRQTPSVSTPNVDEQERGSFDEFEFEDNKAR